MNKPVYQNESPLFAIALIISCFAWGFIFIGSIGTILFLLPVFFIAYLFAQSAFISHLKGRGVLISDAQFPDIQERVKYCAEKTGLKDTPRIYILNGNGIFNAFATRFLRRSYIILLSDILDALEDNPDAINFYIGHEMGHLDRKHIFWEPVLLPALILPLLGAAYSRAREYTSDMYGALCCEPESAQHGLAILAVGGKRYKTLNIQEYLAQLKGTSGFWMSFHELIGNYPWLVKRYARISPGFTHDKIPSRSFFAYILALFVPRLTLMSAIIIYAFLISGMVSSGASIGQEIMKNAKSTALSGHSYNAEPSPTAENPPVQLPDMPPVQPNAMPPDASF